jgi:hypothetical protein
MYKEIRFDCLDTVSGQGVEKFHLSTPLGLTG